MACETSNMPEATSRSSGDSYASSESLLAFEAEKYDISSSQDKRRWRSMGFRLAVACIVLISLITFTAAAISRLVPHDTGHTLRHCGTSPDEARKLGCTFDVMTFCWVRPECDDPELTREFLMLEPWQFYHEQNGTITVPLDVAATGDKEYWTTWKYHRTHCAFMYKKLYNRRGKAIDSHLGSPEHTAHCAHILGITAPAYDEQVITLGKLRYTSCS